MSTPAGSAAFRAWKRPLTRREPLSVMEGRGYVAYVAVIAAAMYGSMLWTFLTSLELGGEAAWSVGRVALLAVGGLAAAGCAAARTGLPLWVSRREATFALGGQFLPRAVLRGRAVAVLLAASVLGAFAAAAAASGGGTGAATTMWALWGAAAAPVPVAVAAAAQARRWRVGAAVLAGALLALGVAVAVAGAARYVPADACLVAATGEPADCRPWADAGPGLAAVAATAAGAVAAWWTVLRAVPDMLDVDDVATRGSAAVGVGQGMAAGDLRAAARAFPVRYRGSRQMLTSPSTAGLTRRFPVVARDLVGQRRRPLVTAAGVVVGTVGAWLATTAHHPAVAAVGGLLLCYAAGATSLGLAAFFLQSVPGGLLPGRGRRVLMAHLVVPTLAALLMVALGRSLADVLAQGTGVSGLVTALCVALVAVLTRAGSATGTSVPPALYTPIPTPMGDLSVVVVAAYFLRGWLVTAGAAWLVALPLARGDNPAWPVAVAAVAILGGIAAARADRA